MAELEQEPQPFSDQLAQFVAQHPVVIPSEFDRLLDEQLKRGSE